MWNFVKVWWNPVILIQIIFWNFDHNKKNYTELRVENYLPEKSHSTLPKQLTNILIKLGILKMFRPVHFKLKVVNNSIIALDWLSKKRVGFLYSFSLWWTVLWNSLWFSVAVLKSLETKVLTLSSFKEVTFQDIMKKQFQPQLTVPSHKQTLLRNTYMKEKYFTIFLRRTIIDNR